MTRLHQALIAIASHLDSLGVPWALIGALALAIRAEARTTRDVDLVVAVADDRKAETLVANLLQRGYRVHEQLEQEDGDHLAAMRLWAPGGDDDAFAALEAHEDEAIRAIGRHGREMAAKQREQAEKEQRQRKLHGI